MVGADKRTAQRWPLASRAQRQTGRHPLWQAFHLWRQRPPHRNRREQMNPLLTWPEALQ